MRRKVILVLDFDGTITVKDTLERLAQIGYSCHRQKAASDGSLTAPLPWSSIAAAYLNDLKQHTDTYTPRASERKTIAQETAWLNSLYSVEAASAARVYGSGGAAQGVFTSVRALDVAREVGAQPVELRTGFAKLVSSVDRVAILSMNWSRRFIRACLGAGEEALYDDDLGKVGVWSNEIPKLITVADREKRNRLEAGWPVECFTCGDKAALLKDITKDTHSLSVYVGDSITDLECLIAADFGVMIRDGEGRDGCSSLSQRELAETCERLEIVVRDIDSNSGDLPISVQATQNCLFHAKDFTQIEHMITRLER